MERNPGPTGSKSVRGSQRGRPQRPAHEPQIELPMSQPPSRDMRSRRSDVNQPAINAWLRSGSAHPTQPETHEHQLDDSVFDDDGADLNTTQLLLEIRSEVKHTNRKLDSLETAVQGLQIENETLKEQNKTLSDEVNNLNEKLSTVEQKLDASERRQNIAETMSRKQNIKVFNLEEVEHESQSDLESRLLNAINDDLQVSEDSTSVDYAYRLPGRVKPRPVLVRCAGVKAKERIMTAFRTKRRSNEQLNIRIGEDLPEYVSKARTKLFPFFKQCIDSGKRAYFKRDFLIVENVKYVFDNETNAPVPVDR